MDRVGDRGFTLIEVLMAMVVLAILAAVAIPALSSWLPDYRLKRAARDMVSNFQLAKMTAVKRNAYCTVSFNQNLEAQICDYSVFVDADADLEYDPGEEVLVCRRWDDYQNVGFDLSKGGGDGLSFLNNDEGHPAVAFQPKGLPVNNLGGLGMGTVYLVNSKGRTTSVVLSSAGNVRID